MDYNFHLVHQLGTANKADALSRWPDFHKGSNDNDNVMVLPQTLFINATTTSSLDDHAHAHQLKFPELLAMWALTHNLTKSDNLYW